MSSAPSRVESVSSITIPQYCALPGQVFDDEGPIPIYDLIESDIAQEALGITPNRPFAPKTTLREHTYKKHERFAAVEIVYPREENQGHDYPRDGSQASQGLGSFQMPPQPVKVSEEESRKRSRSLVTPDFWMNRSDQSYQPEMPEIPGPDSRTYRPRGSKLVRTESLTPEEIMIMIRAARRAEALLVNDAKDHS